ncbi:MAG: hypothetical protein Q7T71_19125 [Herbiconiux sp.]|nr:hypothetical protein [Herbiconiux sp.]
MSASSGGISWKATAAIAVVFFVVAGLSAAPLVGELSAGSGSGAAWWQWLLPVGWLCLGLLQAWQARRKYVAAQSADRTDDPPRP